jgi:hypothetical protein
VSEEQYEKLRELSEKRGVPVPLMVRQGIDRMIDIYSDSLWDIIGMADSDVTDLAENHDKYLAEIYEDENRPCAPKSS